MRFPARVLGVLLAFVLLLFFVSKVSFAQTTNSVQQNSQTPRQTLSPNTNPDVPINLHTWTQSAMIEIMSAMVCQLTGIDPINPSQNCLGVDADTGKIGFVKNGQGAIGMMTNAITMLYVLPVHTTDYFAYLGKNFGLVKSSYAQQTGYGFNSLSPILGLWSAFRNIVYFLFIVIFVIVGVGIMLRVRIDPRTVMTIQNQIPKLIIGIVLVTLSYAIAGFLIDLMYTSIYVATNIIVTKQVDPNISTGIASQIVNSQNPIDAANIAGAGGNPGVLPLGLANIAWNPAQVVGTAIGGLFNNPPGQFIVGLTMAIIGKIAAQPVADIIQGIATIGGTIVGGLLGFFGAGVGAVPGAVAGAGIGTMIGGAIKSIFVVGGAAAGVLDPGGIAGGVASVIAFLIIGIALLVALFKLWFTLIKTYIFILLDIAFAPFWIIAGILPGFQSTVGFGTWFRDLIANLSAFPVTIIMFLLGKVFIDTYGTTQSTTGYFVPPMLGNPASPNGIAAIIGLGIILTTPSVVEIIKGVLKAPKFETGGLDKTIAAGPAVVAGAVGGGLSRTFRTHINPTTGERVAVGAGAQFLDRRIKLPIARTILGFGAKTPREKAAEATSTQEVEEAGKRAVERLETLIPKNKD